MRTPSKGYLAPWSARRETVGLMGTFLIFLIGFPGHSEVTIESAKHAVSQIIQLILVFLGLATPVAHAPMSITAPVRPPAIVRAKPYHAPIKTTRMAIPDPNSMRLNSDPILHHFTYIFAGVASYKGEPCAKASVLVRLISGDVTVAKGAVTDADGSYSVEVSIDAQDMSPVDWSMEAYTPDFKKVELGGRRIVQREEELEKKPIIVTTPVDFVVSLSK